ncbi:MAG TPA: hypothetical protein VH415_01850 [Nitrososphaeraceae archaeon]
MDRGRPQGVVIVAILMIINGIIFIGGSVYAIYFVPILIQQVMNALTGNMTSNFGNLTFDLGVNITRGERISPEMASTITNTIMTVVWITAGIGIAIGSACFLLAWGLFKAKGWAWTITLILAIISIIFSILGVGSGGFVNIINIVISGIILYYLYRPAVKSFFGRVKIPK